MIVLIDDNSVNEPFLPGSGTSMNSSIILTSLLHHQAEFGSQLIVSILDVSLAKWLYLDGTVCIKDTQSGVLLNCILAHPVHQKILSTNCSGQH